MQSSAQSAAAPDDRLSVLVTEIGLLRAENVALKHQLEWFKKQIFGQKSERRLIGADGQQLSFGDLDGEGGAPPPEKALQVPAHTRRQAGKPTTEDDGSGLFFDDSRVPVEVITVVDPKVAGLDPDAYEVISEKVSHRLAQRPGSYVVLKYVRPVVKVKETQALICAPAPQGVIEGSRADVSFLAGLIVDKFAYHLPLYRQHQRLVDAGITVSRPWLTQLTHSALSLLRPIHEAQLESIRASHVVAIDETPIKAGTTGTGKMKAAYFWPVYGDQHEVCFPFFPGRDHKYAMQVLGGARPEGSVLLSDGYGAYSAYAEKLKLTHAQCWAHTRRNFFDAQKVEPDAAAKALDLIGEIYRVEAEIREKKLTGPPKTSYRRQHAAPKVKAFFDWVDKQFAGQGFLPSSPLTEALAYARERRAGLEVFLKDPEVPIDTNHLERTLRVIPMGRKVWMFCWTEVGAEYVGIAQSLIATCRLQGIDPYTYLVDVLQRVGEHPASRVAELTPRLWKQHFADQPLRSDLIA
jgi:transposase